MSSDLRPKLCVLEKGDNGYGFHLHGEKNKLGQYIRHVEDDSPAAEAGLMAGDKLAFVNGENVEDAKHQQVVSHIRGITGKLELIVVDTETANLLQKHNLKCKKEYVTDGIPIPSSAESDHEEEMKNGTPRESTPVPETNGDIRMDRLSVSSKVSSAAFMSKFPSLKKLFWILSCEQVESSSRASSLTGAPVQLGCNVIFHNFHNKYVYV